MLNIQAVIFDLGRVLVEIKTEGEKFDRLMRAMGVPGKEAFSKVWYYSEVREFMTGQRSAEEFYRAAVEKFDLDYSFEDFTEGWCDLFSPMAGMEKLFTMVADRYEVGILSDTDPLHWAQIRALLPWLDRVKKPTLSYEVGYLKPHPVMFATAAENCGKKKEECLFIDDLIENADGARYSGMPALHFNGAEKLRRDLTGLKVL